MNQKRRWYDTQDSAIRAFEILQNLDEESKRRISTDLVEIVRQIKDLHKEEYSQDEEKVLSLGHTRIFGLFQECINKRRWYDTNKDLKYAIRTMSTLPDDDFFNIVEGLTVSLDN